MAIHRDRARRPDPQPVGPRALVRRLERRFGGGGRCRPRACCDGIRRRRLDPGSGSLLRALRPEAPARPGPGRAAERGLDRAQRLRLPHALGRRQRPALRGRDEPAVRRGGAARARRPADRAVDEDPTRRDREASARAARGRGADGGGAAFARPRGRRARPGLHPAARRQRQRPLSRGHRARAADDGRPRQARAPHAADGATRSCGRALHAAPRARRAGGRRTAHQPHLRRCRRRAHADAPGAAAADRPLRGLRRAADVQRRGRVRLLPAGVEPHRQSGRRRAGRLRQRRSAVVGADRRATRERADAAVARPSA